MIKLDQTINQLGALEMKFSRQRLYEQIIYEFEVQFDQGKIQIGDKLPPERELSEEFGVSRGTLRDAFRVLEAQDIIETRHGGGRTLKKKPRANKVQDQEMIDVIRKSKMIDLLEAREIIELGMMELVIERATTEELFQLEQQLLEEKKMLANSHYRNPSFNFHYSLAELSRNDVLIHFMKLNLGVINDIRQENFELDDNHQQSINEHLQILQELQNRNHSKAKECFSNHVRNIKRRINN